ncbi:MAG: hypothetical protein ACOH1Y_14475 [Propionicimonas sp.]
MSTRTGVGVATGMAIVLTTGLTGCTLFTGSPATSPAPSPVLSSAASTRPATPTVSPTSASPSPSPAEPVDATGQLSLYKNNLVTKAFEGTCEVAKGEPTVTLADHSNDFYGTVDLTIVLSADGGKVVSIAGTFGEDSELITRKLVHPDKGTSAVLVTSGAGYRISGKLMVFEDGAKTGTLIPYSIVAKCASSDWLRPT